MSIKTWKKEFITDTGNLIQDGLNKWIGFRKKNLEKHGLKLDPELSYKLIDSEGNDFNMNECSLCDKYFYYHHTIECEDCPLCITRNNVRCDKKREDEVLSPWTEMTKKQNPEPMIQWLKKALKKWSKL